MTFCTNCGAQLKDDAKFCSVCGTKTAAATQETQQQETKAQEQKQAAPPPPPPAPQPEPQPVQQAAPQPAPQPAQQYAQPQAYPQYQQPQYAQPAAKKSNVGGLIAIISVIAVVVVIGGIFGVNAVLKNLRKTINQNTTVQVAEAYMADAVNSTTYAPLNKTNNFLSSSSAIYATVRVTGVKQNTKVSATWTHIPTNKNATSDITATYDGWIGFSLTGGNFEKGQYKVDIFINDALKQTLNFTVN